jgi:lipid-binding SYLF domain-containing protein
MRDSLPMKTLLVGLILAGFATTALALDKAELDYRIRKLTTKFEAMQANPEKRVPAETLRQAKGVVLLDRTKAGFIFAYQGGGGVALIKDPRTDQWSPAAFVKANEASLGFQIGGEQAFYVILLMHTNAVRMLTDAKIDFAGEARGTAGDASAGEEGQITASEHPVLVYADRAGLFGGAAIKGGALSADDDANRIYYGDYLTMQDILFDKKVKMTDSAAELARRLAEQSKQK